MVAIESGALQMLGVSSLSVRYILGRAGVGKTHYIFEEIKKKLEENSGEKLILLVPEQYTLQAERDLLKSLDTLGIMGVEVLSISRLGKRVLNETGGKNKTFINKQGKNMVLKRIINEKAGELTIYSRACRQQGFIENMADLITELKQQDITPELLLEKRVFSDDTALEQKLHDIGLIYQYFNSYMQDRYIDMEDHINLLIKKIKDSSMLLHARVWIDSFTTFSSQSLRVIEEIMVLANETTISLTIDTNPDVRDAQIFDLSWFTIRKIRDIAGKRGLKQEMVSIGGHAELEEKQPALVYLERELYAYPFNLYEDECPQIQIFAARSISNEVEHLAAEVVELVREKGYRYRDIAVVCNNMETYGRLIKRAFANYDIPLFMDEKREIMGNPIVELILSVLEIARGRYRYEDVFRYLKTGFAGIGWDECDILENYVLANGIRGKDWKSPFTRGKEPDLPMLNRWRESIVMPLEKLEEMGRGKKTAREISQALLGFFELIDLPNEIENWADTLGDNAYYEMQSESRQIWNLVMLMLEQIMELLGEQVTGLKEYQQILEAGLQSYEMGIIPTTVDQVLVGSIQRSKSHDIQALFVIGVNDGILPAGSWPEGVFTEEEKSWLKGQGLEVGLSRELKTAEENYLIYSAITKPSRLLRLSYACSDMESRALRPSLLIARFRQLFSRLSISHDLIEDQEIDRKMISTPKSTYKYLVDNLRNHLDGRNVDEIWWDVYSWYRDNYSWQDKNRAVMSGFFHDNQPGSLSGNKARHIYEGHLRTSVSRLEQYINCPFAHFMHYGLKPEKRVLYEIAVPDIGDILHKTMQGLSRELYREKLSWREIDRVTCDNIVNKVSEEILPNYYQGIFESSSRYRYMCQRLKRISRRAAWTLTAHLQKGAFSFLGHEMRFGNHEYCDFPALEVELADGEIVYIEGRIDRVDVLDEDDAAYVKIIDYKSSDHSLKLSDIYYGLNLQLIIYLAAVMHGLQSRGEKTVRPGGIFYFKLDDPLIEAGEELDQEAIETAINKKLKMTGLAVADARIVRQMDLEFATASDVVPVRIKQNGDFYSDASVLEEEWFEKLLQYALQRVGEAAEEMLGGCIKIEPTKSGLHTSCTYCDYKSICQFDQLLENNSYKVIPVSSDEELIKRINSPSQEDEGIV
ncbi:atp-dependent nuclease, subunit b [hydrocarbon metagenome]|uniref:Atp-dependent nuclease, subunit b n=1 Tax=hydrocarbon metagenome TaxID=938273 RepID=A0A0W8E671_9ZZZZ